MFTPPTSSSSFEFYRNGFGLTHQIALKVRLDLPRRPKYVQDERICLFFNTHIDLYEYRYAILSIVQNTTSNLSFDLRVDVIQYTRKWWWGEAKGSSYKTITYRTSGEWWLWRITRTWLPWPKWCGQGEGFRVDLSKEKLDCRLIRLSGFFRGKNTNW